jgi:hypothetical protein
LASFNHVRSLSCSTIAIYDLELAPCFVRIRVATVLKKVATTADRRCPLKWIRAPVWFLHRELNSNDIDGAISLLASLTEFNVFIPLGNDAVGAVGRFTENKTKLYPSSIGGFRKQTLERHNMPATL